MWIRWHGFNISNGTILNSQIELSDMSRVTKTLKVERSKHAYPGFFCEVYLDKISIYL